MSEKKMEAHCLLGDEWIVENGPQALDALQGMRWNRHRDTCSRCSRLPAWSAEDASLPHLASASLRDLAMGRLTPEERTTAGGWLEEHLGECDDCGGELDRCAEAAATGTECSRLVARGGRARTTLRRAADGALETTLGWASGDVSFRFHLRLTDQILAVQLLACPELDDLPWVRCTLALVAGHDVNLAIALTPEERHFAFEIGERSQEEAWVATMDVHGTVSSRAPVPGLVEMADRVRLLEPVLTSKPRLVRPGRLDGDAPPARSRPGRWPILGAIAASLLLALATGSWLLSGPSSAGRQATLWSLPLGETRPARVGVKTRLSAGDRVWIEGVSVPRESHVVVLALTSEGTVAQLYPGEGEEPAPLQAGRVYRLPPQDGWAVGSPGGIETIWIASREEEVQLDAMQSKIASARDVLASDSTRTRGVASSPAPQSPPLRMAQEAVVDGFMRINFTSVQRLSFATAGAGSGR